MSDEPLIEDEDANVLEARLGTGGARLDKALAEVFPTLSRARIQTLLADGAVTRDGQIVLSGSAKAQPGLYAIMIPPVTSATPAPEAIPLTVLFEDADLIVVDKPAGMAAHPAPGSETGTLVNALLAHCGVTLSGIGGVARPGIVHRLDKDTSGVMVAAKSDRAHAGLSALFATHDIERTYIALTRGTPSPARGRIETLIGRSSSDRKKMAVLKSGGRNAVTDYVVQPMYDAGTRDAADPGQGRPAVGQQGVDQRAGLAARRRMRRHAGGLVDNDQVGVLEQHRQGNCFRRRGGGDHRRQSDRVQPRLGPGRPAGDRLPIPAHHALRQQGLKSRP